MFRRNIWWVENKLKVECVPSERLVIMQNEIAPNVPPERDMLINEFCQPNAPLGMLMQN